MKFAKCIVLSLFVPLLLSAAFEDMESGARPEAVGGAFTAVSDDASAIHFNPAGLSSIGEMEFSALYKNLYGIVNNGTFNFVLPTYLGTVGFSFQNIFVKGEYTTVDEENLGEKTLESEKAITLSYGRALNKNLSFGCNFIGYQLTQARFGSASAFGVDLGFLANVYEKWRLGFFTHNLNSPTLGVEKKHNLPRLLTLGLSFTPYDGVVSSVDFSKEVGKDTRLSFGQEFRILEGFTLRAGLSTLPVKASFGVGFFIRNFEIDYSVVNHEVLPLTHIFGVSYSM